MLCDGRTFEAEALHPNLGRWGKVTWRGLVREPQGPHRGRLSPAGTDGKAKTAGAPEMGPFQQGRPRAGR